MSTYNEILEKLGVHVDPTKGRQIGLPTVPADRPDLGPNPIPQAGTGVSPAPVPVVDVISKLEKLAAARPDKLDWKKSIADLLQLLGIDNSYDARKELAVEMGCPADKMSDSYQMNIWLHKTVLQKIAENGGNIPKEFLS